MSITYPTTIDSLTNPLSTDTLDSPSHSGQHSDINDAIEALETKIGVDSSAVTTSIDYKLTNASSSNPGHKHTLTNGASDLTSTSTEVDAVVDKVLIGYGGGTNDDTSAINTFLTTNAGEAVQIPAGNYKITGTIAIPTDTTVYAYGARIFDTTTHRTLVTMASGSRLFGIELEGAGNTTADNTGIGISTIGSDASHYIEDVIIRDCYIHDVGGSGIYSYFLDDARIESTKIKSAGVYGYVGLSVKNVHLTGCHIKDISPGNADGNAYGCIFTRARDDSIVTYPISHDFSVTHSLIEDITVWEGLDTHGGYNFDFSHNTINNVETPVAVMSNSMANGTNFYPPHDFTISNNKILGSGTGIGISITGGTPNFAYNANVNNNLVYNCGIDNNVNSAAIKFTYTRGISVSNNTIYQPFMYGISIYQYNYGFSCIGNTVIDAHASATSANNSPAGITIRVDYNTGIISGNSVLLVDSGLDNFVLSYGFRMASATNNDIYMGFNYTNATDPFAGLTGQNVKYTNYDTAALFLNGATPEGAITAPIGSLCINTAGGAGTTLYVKESGTGNTGWAGL